MVFNNNNNIENIKIGDLGENYYDNEELYKHPKFKTIDEMENADIRNSFILDKCEDF